MDLLTTKNVTKLMLSLKPKTTEFAKLYEDLLLAQVPKRGVSRQQLHKWLSESTLPGDIMNILSLGIPGINTCGGRDPKLCKRSGDSNSNPLSRS